MVWLMFLIDLIRESLSLKNRRRSVQRFRGETLEQRAVPAAVHPAAAALRSLQPASVQTISVKSMTGQGNLIPRSNAIGKSSAHMFAGDQRTANITLPSESLVSISVHVANDNLPGSPFEVGQVIVNGSVSGEFAYPNTGAKGNGWNAPVWISTAMPTLSKGVHQISVRVKPGSPGDGYGTELSGLKLEIYPKTVTTTKIEGEAGSPKPPVAGRSAASGQKTARLGSASTWRSLVPSGASTASFSIRYSNDNEGRQEQISLVIDGTTTGQVTLANTRTTGPKGTGWNQFRDLSFPTVTLKPGTHEVKLVSSLGDGFGWDLDYLTVTQTPLSPVASLQVLRGGDYNNPIESLDENGAPYEGVSVFAMSRSNSQVNRLLASWPGEAGTASTTDPSIFQRKAFQIPVSLIRDLIADDGTLTLKVVIGNSVDNSVRLEVSMVYMPWTFALKTPIPPQTPGQPPLPLRVFAVDLGVS